MTIACGICINTRNEDERRMIAILQNRILIAGCVAWLLSQIAKTIVHLIINKRLV